MAVPDICNNIVLAVSSSIFHNISFAGGLAGIFSRMIPKIKFELSLPELVPINATCAGVKLLQKLGLSSHSLQYAES